MRRLGGQLARTPLSDLFAQVLLGAHATHMLASSQALKHQASVLGREVQQFLSSVRAV